MESSPGLRITTLIAANSKRLLLAGCFLAGASRDERAEDQNGVFKGELRLGRFGRAWDPAHSVYRELFSGAELFSAQRIFHPDRVSGCVTQRGVIKDHPSLFVQRHVFDRLK